MDDTAKPATNISQTVEIQQPQSVYYVGGKNDVEIDALYKKYFKFVYRTCLKMLHIHEEAEDAANNVFEKLHRLKKEGRLNIHSSLGPFGFLKTMAKNMSKNTIRKNDTEALKIYCIATSTSLDYMKKKQPGQIKDLPKTEATDYMKIHFLINEDENPTKEELLIESIIEEEDETNRIIYYMKYHDNQTLEQIGEAVGLKKSAVEKRLDKIKNHIKIKSGKKT